MDGRGLPERAQYVWLLGCPADISDAQLDAFAAYGTGIGPDKVCSWRPRAANAAISARHEP